MNAIKRKTNSFLRFLDIWLWNKPITFVNNIFDASLIKFKEIYKIRVNEVIPKGATRAEINTNYRNLVERYYKHKTDRRNIFVFFLVTVPTFFGAIYFLETRENAQEEYLGMIIFSIFFTWSTIKMFTIYRRKVYKKSKQIIEYEKNFPYLPQDFTLSASIQFKEIELKNRYTSTTNLYRITVIFVLFGLLRMLYMYFLK